jgi:hypothetical protein
MVIWMNPRTHALSGMKKSNTWRSVGYPSGNPEPKFFNGRKGIE